MEVIIKGKVKEGKTTIALAIYEFLRERGFIDVNMWELIDVNLTTRIEMTKNLCNNIDRLKDKIQVNISTKQLPRN